MAQENENDYTELESKNDSVCKILIQLGQLSQRKPKTSVQRDSTDIAFLDDIETKTTQPSTASHTTSPSVYDTIKKYFNIN